MNRIKISPLASASLNKATSPVGEKLVSNLASENLAGLSADAADCSLFVPLHYAKTYQYPLVVWLHNDGSTSEQIQNVMPGLSLRNYAAVAPQSLVGDPVKGFYWEQTRSCIEATHASVTSAIDRAMMRFNIAPDKIFIGGFGAAGTMAYRIAFEKPDLFAGLISINGPIPETHTPLSDWKKCRHLELFWAHCRNSITFDQSKLCQQLRLLHIAGFSVTLRQYPGDDQLVDSMLSDVNCWIMDMIQTAVTD